MNTSKDNHQTGWAAVILSAGLSSRMQQHKALLRFDAHRTFIRKIVDEYARAGCRQIVVVTNQDNSKPIQEECSKIQNTQINFVINDHLEKEKFFSVRLGIERCLPAGGCFIQPCDSPFITAALLKKMLLLAEDDSYVVPVYQGRKGHPVLLGRNLMKGVSLAEDDAMNFKYFLSDFNSIHFETSESHVLDNINTINDYNQHFNK
ncbi:MAG TPA: NTP transferase domain-containing protein [Bacteroidales bacterium]|nr:NTP transferase domain-containing protein [Bacteroidales bacterium]HPB26130.1 NTP transferase domain-containing protein [Bacteroidales bacterium]HPI30759.1 NTP transferase domain-containing protein [Bacteroidales bacterium]HQP15072.1 NTP transferase domain-containing protein [Bacteroidales bacterium]